MLKRRSMSLVSAYAFLAPPDLRSIESTAVRYNPGVAAKSLQHRFEETLLRLGG